MNENQKFENLIKRTKAKNNLRGIMISAFSTIIILIMILLSANFFIAHTMNKQSKLQDQKLNIEKIAFSPNIFTTSQSIQSVGWTKATLTETRIKNIDGYHIHYPKKSAQFSVSGIQLSSGNDIDVYNTGSSIIAKNNKTQEKEPIFFSRSPSTIYKKSKKLISYTPATHEAKKLSAMNNTLAEVALTFDNSYSYDEIRKIIPDNIMINYYWLGFGNNNIDTMAGVGRYIGLNASTDGRGTLIEGSSKNHNYIGYNGLKQALTDSSSLDFESRNLNQNYISSIKAQLSSNLKKAKFNGVIVSGKSENLKNLDDLNFVFASNVGATTPIVPFEEPLK
ncbi:hypothetical protein GCM10025879_13280 [Leuconostoc litchii]|uniref:Anti-sigma factor n=1 Tax=Leuconostoc litchii TaxID=1981069 RepID=A0A6P2CQC6_9LACO|nr:anti sigma factor C-terminal domain-containing protein [Leuconostoc litchii]TYC46352.1 anti-sigma factor [Leuconostoc litchii]GMA70082.1 hypothetical protein GCM10025879_13280 [Leuconostoc litchii]